MSQIYNDNTKRPKPKENQLGILGISSREFTHFDGNSAGPWVQERALLGRRIYLWEYTQKVAASSPKIYRNFTQWFR